MEKLLTAQDVSEILGYTDPKARTVRNLWKAGQLEGAKVGRRILFTERSVERFIRNQFEKQKRSVRITLQDTSAFHYTCPNYSTTQKKG